MDINFIIVQPPPVTLAVTEAFVRKSEIAERITGLFDIVYTWLPSDSNKQIGNNYVLYDQFSQDGMRLRVGFPVAERFQDTPQVKCLQFEGGRAVQTQHIGAYKSLIITHQKIHDWCAEQSLEESGLSWEVYGDWHNDETILKTDVYIGLK